MSSDPRAFAERVIRAFAAARRYTDDEIKAAGGPSSTTMTNLRKVARGEEEMGRPRAATFRRIDRAARWVEGSARELWERGDEPAELADEDPRSIEERLAAVEARVARLEELIGNGDGSESRPTNWA